MLWSQSGYCVPGLFSTGMSDHLLQLYHLCILNSYLGQLSLAIPPWVGKINTGDDLDHC